MSNRGDRDLEYAGRNDDPDETVKVQKENERKQREALSPWETSYSPKRRKFLLVTCVIGVLIDPFFLYVPIIDEDKKCVTMDKKIMIVALILRIVTDFMHLLHMTDRYLSAFKTSRELNLSLWTRFPALNLLNNNLAIIPLPQALVLTNLSLIAGSRSLAERKIFSFFLLLQYLPRILSVYLAAEDLELAFDSITGLVWVRGAFNFFLYVIAGHVFGALWYFYSIYRETACWHHACKKVQQCSPNSFYCHGNTPMHNLTFINEFCPINPQIAEVFDFGIFVDAIKSRMLSTSFLNKLSRCFWWGLRNLSSFGSNLQTSSNTEENLFAVLISISGLLLFLYLIGNLQIYMQLATKKSEKLRVKINDKQREIESNLSNLPEPKQKLILSYVVSTIKQGKDLDMKYLISLLDLDDCEKKLAEWVFANDRVKQYGNTKEEQAKSWMERYKDNIPHDMGSKIVQYVKLGMREGEDVDVRNVLSIIPARLVFPVKKHLCFPILKKVPMLENMGEEAYNTICMNLKPMVYQENSFIFRKGEPLDFMLFITQGVVWTFGSKTNPMKRLQRHNYYGNELLEYWQLKTTPLSDFPIATCHVKCGTKVEAFTLSLIGLDDALTKFSAVPDHARKGGHEL